MEKMPKRLRENIEKDFYSQLNNRNMIVNGSYVNNITHVLCKCKNKHPCKINLCIFDNKNTMLSF